MYTQCPECLTIFEIDENALQASLGIVQCGHCSQRFDALHHLSDSLPFEPGSFSDVTPRMPTLTHTVAADDSTPATRQDSGSDTEPLPSTEAAPPPDEPREAGREGDWLANVNTCHTDALLAAAAGIPHEAIQENDGWRLTLDTPDSGRFTGLDITSPTPVEHVPIEGGELAPLATHEAPGAEEWEVTTESGHAVENDAAAPESSSVADGEWDATPEDEWASIPEIVPDTGAATPEPAHDVSVDPDIRAWDTETADDVEAAGSDGEASDPDSSDWHDDLSLANVPATSSPDEDTGFAANEDDASFPGQAREAEPEPTEAPAPQATETLPTPMPAIEPAPDVDAAAESAPADEPGDSAVSGPVYVRPRRARLSRASVLWTFGCVVLALILVAQLVWAKRVALFKSPQSRPWLTSLCHHLPCDLPPIRDIAKLELLSRDIRPDPNVPGALTITATMRNNAAFRQPWPIVAVELDDLDGNPVAMRRFRPARYMPDPTRRAAGIAPGATAAVAFEVADPGKRAVAFQFSFE